MEFIAISVAKQLNLRLRFNAFGGDLKAKRVTHADDGFGDRQHIPVAVGVLDEHPVDFHPVDKKSLQIGER